jgi:hypothetical protein
MFAPNGASTWYAAGIAIGELSEPNIVYRFVAPSESSTSRRYVVVPLAETASSSVTEGVASPGPHRLGDGSDAPPYVKDTLGISHETPTPEVDCPCIPIATVPEEALGTVICANTALPDGPWLGSI